jgi:hypothetical protein
VVFVGGLARNAGIAQSLLRQPSYSPLATETESQHYTLSLANVNGKAGNLRTWTKCPCRRILCHRNPGLAQYGGIRMSPGMGRGAGALCPKGCGDRIESACAGGLTRSWLMRSRTVYSGFVARSCSRAFLAIARTSRRLFTSLLRHWSLLLTPGAAVTWRSQRPSAAGGYPPCSRVSRPHSPSGSQSAGPE